MSSIEPSPQTTLVIFLGASEWPLSSLRSSPAFRESANKIRDYFCHSRLFGLPPKNWLDLFNKRQSNPNEVDQAIGNFLDQRILELKQAGTPARDVLFYYIGHGVFTSYEQAYHLAIQSTRDENIGSSAVAMASLAHTLKTKAMYLRRIVILDCCFAAESFKYMQAAPDQVAVQQTFSALEEKSIGKGFPGRGTALLCSSGHKVPSLILPDDSGTMFSEAFVRALSLEKIHQPHKTHLPLYDLKQPIIDMLDILAGENAPRPELHSPDQSYGDVASVPFFPNPRVKEERRRAEEQARRIEEEESARKKKETEQATISPPPQPAQPTISPTIPVRPTRNDPGRATSALPLPKTPVTQSGKTLHPPLVYPSPETIKPRISRRAVITTLAVAGLATLGGVLVWNTPQHQSSSSPTPVSTTQTSVTTTPEQTAQTVAPTIPIGTLLHTYHASDMVYTVAWSPNGQSIAAGGFGNTVQIWDATTSRLFHSYDSRYPVNAVAWSPNGQRIAWGGADRTVEMWDVTTGKHVYTYSRYDGWVYTVAWSPNGQRIALGGNANTLQVWDATTGQLLHTYPGHFPDQDVNAVAWSPNGKLIASGSYDLEDPNMSGFVQVWDATTGRLVYTYTGQPEGGVYAVAWSPSGQRIASGSSENTVQVWDATTGGHVYTYTGHSSQVNAVAWSPNGQRIASGGNDGTVQVWDATTGRQIYTYDGHGERVTAVVWSPNGKLIASGGLDHTVQVWSAGS